MRRQMTLPFFAAAALATAVATAQTAQPEPHAQQPPSRSAQVQVPAPAPGTEQGQKQDQEKSRHQSSAKRDAHKGSTQAAATETRPDAKYQSPSGQDSQPDTASHKTRVATGDTKRGTGTADNRGTKEGDQTRPVRKLSEQKTYTGNSGNKADPSTACSTSRPTKDGGVDCGTSGNSATEGKILTKPR